MQIFCSLFCDNAVQKALSNMDACYFKVPIYVLTDVSWENTWIKRMNGGNLPQD